MTGQPSLFVSPTITLSVKGFLPEESNALLKFLHYNVRNLDFSCRVRWEKGYVVVRDQRSVARSGVSDFLRWGEEAHVENNPIRDAARACISGIGRMMLYVDGDQDAHASRVGKKVQHFAKSVGLPSTGWSSTFEPTHAQPRQKHSSSTRIS